MTADPLDCASLADASRRSGSLDLVEPANASVPLVEMLVRLEPRDHLVVRPQAGVISSPSVGLPLPGPPSSR